jgi:methylenetetrahydrofolate dehydrogenase (NADP+)/methenyltetrahydrofolate cyclohydrolase
MSFYSNLFVKHIKNIKNIKYIRYSHNYKLLDGKFVSNIILNNIKNNIETNNYKITLNSVVVGENPDSLKYINIKNKVCNQLKIKNNVLHFNKSISENELIQKINIMNNDKNINAILIQSPLPNHINSHNVFSIIDNKKDVDCFNSTNIGNLYYDKNNIVPCTPKGIIKLLDYYNIDIVGKHIVIIGSSNIVGKPLSLLLSNRNSTTTLCNKDTIDIKDITRKADIIISACGQKELIDKTWIGNKKPVIVDVGINIVNKKIYGDVNFNSVKNEVSYITPVSGGVGPMTISMLMLNIIELYEKFHLNR